MDHKWREMVKKKEIVAPYRLPAYPVMLATGYGFGQARGRSGQPYRMFPFWNLTCLLGEIAGINPRRPIGV